MKKVALAGLGIAALAFAPLARADVPGLAPFVGTWEAHEKTLVIDSTGKGVGTYQDLGLCPSCSAADAPSSTWVLTLTSVSNGAATGSITASSDAQNQNLAVGKPVTAQIAPGLQGKGVVLQMTIGGVRQVDYCDSAAGGQCGA